MEDIGEVRPEDVLEVAVGAVEGAHSGEGVLLVEGVEDDQAPVASGIDAVVGGAEDAPDVNIGVAGEAAADLVTVEEEADTRSDRPGQSFNNSRLGGEFQDFQTAGPSGLNRSRINTNNSPNPEQCDRKPPPPVEVILSDDSDDVPDKEKAVDLDSSDIEDINTFVALFRRGPSVSKSDSGNSYAEIRNQRQDRSDSENSDADIRIEDKSDSENSYAAMIDNKDFINLRDFGSLDQDEVVILSSPDPIQVGL